MKDLFKVIFLFIAVLYTYSNTCNAMARLNVSSWDMVFQAIGITGFVYLQWLT